MKQSHLDLGGLEAFVAVATSGSFTKAARRLGTSKVAASRRVTALEELLGERLLTRTTRAVGLTPAGEIVLERAGPLLERAAELVDSVGAEVDGPRGRLRIVASQLLYDVMLEPVVLPFLRKHRQLQVALDVADAPLAALREGHDLALTVGPPPDSSMGSLKIGKAELGWYASAKYVEAQGAPASPAALAEHTVAVVGGAHRATWSFTRGGRSTSVSLTPRLAFASHDLVLRAVAAGVAVARLPHFYVRRSALRAGLVPILGEWSTAPVPAYAVFPNRDRPPAPVRAFLAELRERAPRARG